MHKLIPFIKSIQNYSKDKFKGDISAGLTVGVMLIPQGMAYAMIAGLPPIYGLYASTIPIIIYALLGTSQQLAVGPAAMIALLTAAGIGTMAPTGSESYISLVITLTMIVGVIHVLLGTLRLGFLVNFISHPVISGFTSAAAIIIFLSQLKNLLGFDIPRGEYTYDTLVYAIRHIQETDGLTLLIGVAAIAILITLKKIKSIIPGPIVIVVLGIVGVTLFGLKNQISIVGSVPEGLPSFIIPNFNIEIVIDLAPLALIIALIIFMQSIAVAKAIHVKHKDYKILPNQELIALGAANIAGSFFQSFPVTGGLARSAVNDQAGAKSVVASLITSGLIIMTLLFLTPLFSNLPNAVLAAIIAVAVYSLFNYKEASYLWKTHKADFWMMAITFVVTLALGIEQGIMAGVILSLGMMIYKTTKPHIAELAKVPGSEAYRNVSRFDELENRDDLLILRWDAQLYFANIAYFKDEMERRILIKGKFLQAVILDMESITDIDSSGLHTLEDFIGDINQNHLKLYIAGVRGPVRDLMVKGKLIDLIGKQNLFLNVNSAVVHHDHPEMNTSTSMKYVLQSNIKPLST